MIHITYHCVILSYSIVKENSPETRKKTQIICKEYRFGFEHFYVLHNSFFSFYFPNIAGWRHINYKNGGENEKGIIKYYNTECARDTSTVCCFLVFYRVRFPLKDNHLSEHSVRIDSVTSTADAGGNRKYSSSHVCCMGPCSPHSPDRLNEWRRNSILGLLHWLYNSNQKCSWSCF